jgi:16S rRNA (cytidine1402-2'-O)-methyltransferase
MGTIVNPVNVYQGALLAATRAASAQHYPQGALYVVATPIGNLADITLRAMHVLSVVDAVACEDTRHTQSMLRAYGIEKTSLQLLAVHQHNEAMAALAVIDRLHGGQRVAYVSDAGTPAVSDPGARLVAAVRERGLQVIPLPGASSVTTLLSVAGVSADVHRSQGFEFVGFLPGRASERAEFLKALATEHRAVVLLEAPHRIESAAQALSVLGVRRITVGRELTKQFEEIATVNARDFPGWIQGSPSRIRGEFVLVIHPREESESDAKDHRLLKLLLQEVPLKSAVRITAEMTGASKNELYEAALALKATQN